MFSHTRRVRELAPCSGAAWEETILKYDKTSPSQVERVQPTTTFEHYLRQTRNLDKDLKTGLSFIPHARFIQLARPICDVSKTLPAESLTKTIAIPATRCDSASRFRCRNASGCTHHCGHQSRSGRNDFAGHATRGPLLSAECNSDLPPLRARVEDVEPLENLVSAPRV